MNAALRQNSPATLDSLDPDTREAAKKAARRLGMSVEDWLASVISDKMRESVQDPTQKTPPNPPAAQKRVQAPAFEELDQIAAKLAKVSSGRQDTPSAPPLVQGRDIQSLISVATSESERRARENASKTATALESVSRWIETAEDRLNESARAALEQQERTAAIVSETFGLVTRRLDEADQRSEALISETMRVSSQQQERTAHILTNAFGLVTRRLEEADERSEARIAETVRVNAEQQERTAQVLGKALNLMTRRLDDIEKKVTEGHQPSMISALKAIEKLEANIARVSQSREDSEQTAAIERALLGFESRIAEIADKVDSIQSQQTRRRAALHDDLGAAVVEIRSKQNALQDEARRNPPAPGFPREHTDILNSLRGDITKLASKLETVRPGQGDEKAFADIKVLQADIERMHATLNGVATREEVGALEQAVHHLSRHLDEARHSAPDTASLMTPVRELKMEVSRLSEAVADGIHGRLAHDLAALARRLEEAAHNGVNPQALDDLSRQFDDIRAIVSDLADPQRIEHLGEELAALNRKIEGIGARQVDQGEISSLKQAVDDVRATLKQRGQFETRESSDHARQFEALAQKLDALQQGASRQDIRVLAEQFEMLANRLDERGHSSNGAFSLQIEKLSQKLDRIAAKPQPDMSLKLDQLSSRIESALAHPKPQPEMHALVERLDRLDQSIKRPNESAPVLNHLVEKVNRIDESLRQPAKSPELDSLFKRLDKIDEAVRRPIEAQSLSQHLRSAGESTALGAVIERLDKIDNKIKPQQVELKPLEDLLRSLADKIDRADKPDASPRAFDALERQIASLTQHLEQRPAADPALSGLERAMHDLMGQVETMRSGAVEAAQHAARLVVSDTLSGPSSHIDHLTRDLDDLKSRHVQADRRMQNTLDGVNETLEKVVAKLTHFESGSKPAEARPPEPHRAAVAQGSDQETIRQIRAAVKAQITANSSSSSIPAEADRALPASKTVKGVGDEILLEPGAPRPRGQKAQSPADAASAGDGKDVKANFIAAARRAAQAAAAEAASNKSIAASGGEASEIGGLATRLKRTLHQRRRPLLLGLAAVVMALGTFQIAGYKSNSALLTQPQSAQNTSVRPAAPVVRDVPAAAIVPAAEPEKAEKLAVVLDGKSILNDKTLPENKNVAADDKPVSAPVSAAPEPSTTGSIDARPKMERIANMASLSEIQTISAPPALRQAVLSGDPVAVFDLASRAVEGRGVPRDPKIAAKLFEKAAAYGLAPAQYRLGSLYEKGLGVSKDLSLAKLWYQRAAEKGNAKAMHNLAVLAAEGSGGKPDYTGAVEWFRSAAEHGIRDSQFNLAVLLARGLGTTQDLGQAYVWFALAAAQGDEDAGKKREEVGQRLAAADLTAAKAKVDQWRPQTLDQAANDVAIPANAWSEAPKQAPARRT